MVTSRCVLCGAENADDGFLCRHYTVGDQEWAVVNRLFCNFLHRGVVPIYPTVPGVEEPWLILDVEIEREEMAVV